MNCNLIPFGLRRLDQQMVSVDEVERGLASDCVCPSCGLPLVAKNSDAQIKVPHFAHHTRGQQVPDKECDLSFAVSVRLMMHQLSRQGQLWLKTPRLDNTLTKLSIEQCKSRLIELDNVQVDTEFEGISVDLVTEVKGHKLIVFFTHQNRRIPDALRTPQDKKCGVISLDIDGLADKFDEAEDIPYLTILKRYLEDTESHRIWVFNRYYSVHLSPDYSKSSRSANNSTLNKTSRDEPLTGQALSDEMMKIGLAMRKDPPRWTNPSEGSRANSYLRKKRGD